MPQQSQSSTTNSSWLPPDLHESSVESIDPRYYQKLLEYKNFTSQTVGSLYKVNGFNDHNFLIDINSIFSSHPKFEPVDRTGQVNHPIRWSNRNPWISPARKRSLREAMQARVEYFENLNSRINIFWSGGIDSTAIVTAFLLYCQDRHRLRIIYSPWSYYEHPEYLEFLKKFPEVELIDQSGETYLDLTLDGVYITGNSGDEIHASMDSSFLEKHGIDILNTGWRDFFYQCMPNNDVMDFCERYFSGAGIEINTVLEARWWFYTACKIDSITREHTIPFLVSNRSTPVSIDAIHGFFNCIEYQEFIAWNIPDIINNDAASWRKFLKDFCYDFDHIDGWWRSKVKFHSTQFHQYKEKKLQINDQRYLAILDDGTVIKTPNLPFFSQAELRATYGSSLDQLFNDPGAI